MYDPGLNSIWSAIGKSSSGVIAEHQVQSRSDRWRGAITPLRNYPAA
jgi:hypothetical protein